MVEPKKKTKIALFSIILILTLLYIFSIFNKNTKDKRKVFQTSLINSKNITQINKIEIQDCSDNSFLEIVKSTNMMYWKICNYKSDYLQQTDKNYIISNQNKIENLINYLTSVINMYKVLDTKSSSDSFLSYFSDQSDLFYITYYLDDGNSSVFCFGKHNFLQDYRFFMTNNSNQLYEIPTSIIDNYLTTDILTWQDPLLLPTSIFKDLSTQNIQLIKAESFQNNLISSTNLLLPTHQNFSAYTSTLLSLRSSNYINSVPNTTETNFTLTLEMGDKKSINIKVFDKTQQYEYITQIIYYDNNQNIIESYYTYISQWTLNKLIDLFNQL